ncbi:hypothetical protein MMC07_003537 [Pseudocyphellaria aurata]|nr:hypothetical protein [Pseudocyphellaria aurata]
MTVLNNSIKLFLLWATTISSFQGKQVWYLNIQSLQTYFMLTSSPDYAIKWGDIGLLRVAMQEVCIIIQAPAAGKPKYAKEMLQQLHILDSRAADPVLRDVYLANAIVNPRGLPNTFYEMDLLLEHQNGEFKKFRVDRGSSLKPRIASKVEPCFPDLLRMRLAKRGSIWTRSSTSSFNQALGSGTGKRFRDDEPLLDIS